MDGSSACSSVVRWFRRLVSGPGMSVADFSTHKESTIPPSKYSGNQQTKPWTTASDDADDKKKGIREDSKQDKALDKKRGVK